MESCSATRENSQMAFIPNTRGLERRGELSVPGKRWACYREEVIVERRLKGRVEICQTKGRDVYCCDIIQDMFAEERVH